MEQENITRRRVKALDGTSFRLEKRDGTLSVNDVPTSVHSLSGGIVALESTHKTVQVSAAQYWELLYEDVAPTKLLAGILLAQLHEQRARYEELCAHIMALGQQKDDE